MTSVAFNRVCVVPKVRSDSAENPTGRASLGKRQGANLDTSRQKDKSSRHDIRFTPRAVDHVEDRVDPRVNWKRKGPRSLSQTELLGLLLEPKALGQSTYEKAHGLARRYGARRLARLKRNEIESLPLDPEESIRIQAALELGRRAWSPQEAHERRQIHGPAQAWKQVRRIGSCKKEHLVGLYLDVRNGLVLQETICIGSLNTTRAHPREILRPAIEHLAVGFILAHNHPSGTLQASAEDVAFTRAIHRASELMGIELYDHLIVTSSGYISLRERGLFQPDSAP